MCKEEKCMSRIELKANMDRFEKFNRVNADSKFVKGWRFNLYKVFTASILIFFVSFLDWITDIFVTSSTAWTVWNYTDSSSVGILFYMSTLLPIGALMFTTLLAILDKPWQLLYYQWKVSWQLHFDRFDKPELAWHAEKVDNYAVLNRYKFSLTQGGQ